MKKPSSMRLIFPLFMVSVAGFAKADTGDPIAIRSFDGGFVIESMWNFSIRILQEEGSDKTDLEGVDLLRNSVSGSNSASRFVQPARPFDSILDRPANVGVATWKPWSTDQEYSSNAIRIRGDDRFVFIEVDGVQIAFIDTVPDPDSRQWVKQIEDADVLVLGNFNSDETLKIVTSASWIVRSSEDVAKANHNTFCVHSDLVEPETAKTVWLHNQVKELPEDVETLMAAKEAACKASQTVFENLSVKQMNFRPGNGSHTPRWNTEHMMGRELLFFSQIYHALENSIPVIDLNPKQMPADYIAKHSDWDGSEEARQMQRVSSFTRRFAYLLDGLPLGNRAPGSSWKLDALLRQMDRHYTEHTANVKKKFALEDWPNE